MERPCPQPRSRLAAQPGMDPRSPGSLLPSWPWGWRQLSVSRGQLCPGGRVAGPPSSQDWVRNQLVQGPRLGPTSPLLGARAWGGPRLSTEWHHLLQAAQHRHGAPGRRGPGPSWLQHPAGGGMSAGHRVQSSGVPHAPPLVRGVRSSRQGSSPFSGHAQTSWLLGVATGCLAALLYPTLPTAAHLGTPLLQPSSHLSGDATPVWLRDRRTCGDSRSPSAPWTRANGRWKLPSPRFESRPHPQTLLNSCWETSVLQGR